jgi:hypothetical protein
MQKIIDIPEINIALSQLRENLERFDSTGLYEKYLQLTSTVSEWRVTANATYFQPFPYYGEIIVGESPKLIKKKYKNMDEARWLGKYCCGYVNGECVLEIFPTHKNVDTLLVSFLSGNDDSHDECHINFKSIKNIQKMETRLISISKCFKMSNNESALIRSAHGEEFMVSLYKFHSNGIPSNVRFVSKGYSEWGYYFHYRPDGEMYKISTDELGKIVHWKKK